jgi:hypothetical protein
LTDSFYITGEDKSLMNKVYSSQSKAVGSDTGVYDGYWRRRIPAVPWPTWNPETAIKETYTG